ncbi:MAG: hypothetical protein HY749_07175 [Gammaproteobacteria bacterium]|nr:hypothetical protein [Gammaproteobacteria bacterium]
MADRDELAALRAENTRLIALLESQGIEWRLPSRPAPAPEPSRLSTDEKVALFCCCAFKTDQPCAFKNDQGWKAARLRATVDKCSYQKAATGSATLG